MNLKGKNRPFVVLIIIMMVCSMSYIVYQRMDLEKSFPQGFLWGTGMSAFQVEMGRGEVASNSDWFVWVHDETNIKNGIVSGDKPENGPGFWELYPNDLKLAKEDLGNNAIRLSIDWSRIFLNPTRNITASVYFDSKGNILSVDIPNESMRLLEERAYQPSVQRYREILTECQRLGLTVLLTLYHWPLPLWLHDPIACRDDFARATTRGWADSKTIIEFAKYSAYVAKTFGDLVDIYATLNEPMVVSGDASQNSGFPPGLFDLPLFIEVTKNLAIAHGIAYEQVKKWDKMACSDFGSAYVGIVHNPQYYQAFNKDSEADVKAAQFVEYLYNEWILNMIMKGNYDLNLNMVIEKDEQHPDLVKGCDFIGVNYYTRNIIKSAETKIPGFLGFEGVPCAGNCSDMGWEIYPSGIRYILNWIYKNYEIPIFITENGIADAKDEKRTNFILSHLNEIYNAIHDDGVPVKGYFYWSLIDNFEWTSGFRMRFGLYTINYETKERIPTKAVPIYRQIATTDKLEFYSEG